MKKILLLILIITLKINAQVENIPTEIKGTIWKGTISSITSPSKLLSENDYQKSDLSKNDKFVLEILDINKTDNKNKVLIKYGIKEMVSEPTSMWESELQKQTPKKFKYEKTFGRWKIEDNIIKIKFYTEPETHYDIAGGVYELSIVKNNIFGTWTKYDRAIERKQRNRPNKIDVAQQLYLTKVTKQTKEDVDESLKVLLDVWVASFDDNYKIEVTQITKDNIFLSYNNKKYKGTYKQDGSTVNVAVNEYDEFANSTNDIVFNLSFFLDKLQGFGNSKSISPKPFPFELQTKKIERVKRERKQASIDAQNERIKKQEEEKKYTEKLATKRADKKEKERLDKIELKRKRSLLTETEINKVQANLQELSKITDELVGRYKEIKRYGRFTTLSMIKNYNSYYSKWLKLYNGGRIEKRPEHMTENQELVLLVLEQVLMKQKIDSNFKKILNSNY